MAVIDKDIDYISLQLLETEIGLEAGKALVQAALTLLNWAVKESLAGRVIQSAENDGSNVDTLTMAALDYIRPAVPRSQTAAAAAPSP